MPETIDCSNEPESYEDPEPYEDEAISCPIDDTVNCVLQYIIYFPTVNYGYYIVEPSNPVSLEPLDQAYFKVKGEVWLAEPNLTNGGGYTHIEGEVFLFDLQGIDVLSLPCGGAYFNR
jgi:hypothetical protein